MSNIVKIPSFAVLFLMFSLSSNSIAYAQEEDSFSSQKVSDGLYMLSAATGFTGGNIAVSVGNDGVAVIDNGIASVLEKLRAEISKITDKPVDYLINTHEHGDHTGNNQAFGADGTTLVSHRNLRTSLIKNGVGNGEAYVAPAPEALPEITFNDEMTLYINGDTARLMHFANAHTDGDAVIYFQNNNVIHTGDILFNGLFPFIDMDNGGSLEGMLSALKSIVEIGDNNTKIIPGHGKLASKTDIVAHISMLESSRAMVAELIAAGKSDEEILQANPLASYQDYHWGFITTERMTKQLIRALRPSE